MSLLVERCPCMCALRFDRPVGTRCCCGDLAALWVAAGDARCALVAGRIGTLVMRAAGCVINDWADRNLDPTLRT
jgi:4-hydroxybenzoate polyprenyltransferase